MLSKKLVGITDIERLHRKALLGRLGPTQFCSLDLCYTQVFNLESILEQHQISFTDNGVFIDSLRKLRQEYSKIINLDLCFQWNLDQIDQNPFYQGVYPELDEYQKKVTDSINYFYQVSQIGYLNQDLVLPKRSPKLTLRYILRLQ